MAVSMPARTLATQGVGNSRDPYPDQAWEKRSLLPARPSTKKALLKLNFSCNNRCTFCHAVDNPLYPGDETRFAVRKMRVAKAQGAEMIVFSGGESTIRQDFFVLVKAALRLGLKHGVITNGRMLSYPEFTEKYLSLEPEYVYVSLHGAKPSTHNRMVLAPAFHHVIAGLKNVSGRVLDLTVNTVVTHINLRELKDMVDLLLPLSPIRLKFSYVEPKGNAHHQFEDVVPPIHEAAQYVNEAIAYGEEKGAAYGLQMGCENFVPCLIDDYARYNADLFTDSFIYMSESTEETFFPVDSGKRTYLPACLDCSLKDSCQGLFADYVAGVGEENVKVRSQRKPVPTGFIYTAMGSVERVPGDCPVSGMPLNDVHPQRDLFFLEGDRVMVCRAQTAAFTHELVRAVKRETQQLYLDVSSPDRGRGFKNFDDYRQNRRKLRLRSACTSCPKLSACPATYEVSEGERYGLIEEKIRQIVTGLRGAVLDVGCGRILYADLLRDAANKNIVNYVGVDPEPVSLSGFTVVQSTIEDWEYTPASFDSVLVLRSYNHFYDLRKAFDVIFGALKPAGALFIVENGPSVLVRNSSDPEQLRASSAEVKDSALKTRDPKLGFEHYRNHTSHDALRFLQAYYPVSVIEHVPLVADLENQWLLILRKESSEIRDQKLEAAN